MQVAAIRGLAQQIAAAGSLCGRGDARLAVRAIRARSAGTVPAEQTPPAGVETTTTHLERKRLELGPEQSP